MSTFTKVLSYVLLGLVIGCAAPKKITTIATSAGTPPPETQLRRSFFLIGDSYQVDFAKDAGVTLLSEQMAQSGAKGVALWLGNNFYHKGLPDERFSRSREQAEASLTQRLQLMDRFKGMNIMLPGYHDWDAGGPNGYRNVINMEELVEDYLDEEDVVMPDGACPGPVEIDLADDLVLLLLNTQWWLHEWEKPGVESACELVDKDDFLVHFEDVLRRNRNKKVIIAGHHPIYSDGLHGGYFSPGYYWTPPILGALYIKYRKSLGNRKDFANLRYRGLRKAFQTVCSGFPNLIYVGGLEKSMQLHHKNDQHYITGGSLDQATAVSSKGEATFAASQEGFGKINLYQNGDVWLEFWSSSNSDSPLYRQLLFNHQYAEPDSDRYIELDFQGQTTTAVGNSKLKKEQERPGWRGNNYRQEWTTEVSNIPVFDIGKTHGGLTPIKRGGGLQTISLRMEAQDGKQYVLRSIEKYPEKAVPRILRGTIASDVVSDQISASHPYAALAIPPMADAVGVYHTNPQLVYVPDDPRLGIYREDFADHLFLFEERPAGDWSDLASFGNSEDIISTLKVIRNLKKKERHQVDQLHVVRSRLFDIVIGDWDRHDDQWRWASVKEDGFTVYRPIPRDRDQAFFYGDGTLLQLSSHKWGNPKTQGFHHEIRDIEGLEFNARWFDRTFITEPSWEEWKIIAEDIQAKLTDEVIEQGLKQLPPEIYEISGSTIAEKLKRRRDDLERYARQYYEFISEEVEIIGTSARELFEITRQEDGRTTVTVSSLNKEGQVRFQRYTRTFNPEVTKEIRVYGYGAPDQFLISGEESSSIKLRIIGGKGNDQVENKIQGGAASKVLYYDNSNKENQIIGKVADRTRPGNGANDYNRKAFKYDQLMPLVLLSFNPDDGIYFGGGFVYTKNGFRKVPYAARHTLTGRYAIKSGSFDFDYKGEFADVLGKWDYVMTLDINQPSYAEFFYGFGNKTRSDEDIRDEDNQFYRARYSQWQFHPKLRGNFGAHELQLGGYWRSVEVKTSNNDEEPNRFILSYADLVGRGSDSNSPLLDVGRNYLAAVASYSFDTRDSEFVPRKGFRFHLMGKSVSQIGDEKNNYQHFSSDAAFYLSTGGILNTTLAVRAGGAVNTGDFEFYQGNHLGGLRNLRGYRIYRFNGDQSFYQNTELRIKMADFRTNLFPGQVGINLFHDIGRVWADNPDEILEDPDLEDWHRGYGGGLWVAPFGRTVIAGEFATSEDEGNNVFMLRLGFMF